MTQTKDNYGSAVQSHKSVRAIVYVVYWVWLVLLGILLIVAIIMQSPWKVLTVIGIFLTAATILPKRFRKWFWAAVGAVVIALGIWIVLPTDYEGWEQYEYDLTPQLAKLEQERAVAPSENAAVDYEALMEAYDANEDAMDLAGAVFNGPWKTADYPDVAAYIDRHAQIIWALTETSKIPECRFPLDNPSRDCNNWTPTTYGRARIMRQWMHLAVIAANNDAGEGRTAQAIEEYATAARMGEHLIQQGTALDMLTGIPFKSLAYRHARTLILNGLDEGQVNMIEQTMCFPERDWEGVWRRMLEYDKVMAAGWLEEYYEVNKNGRIRLSPEPGRAERIRVRELLTKSQNGEGVAGRQTDSNDPNGELIKWMTHEYMRRQVYPAWLRDKQAKAWSIITWLYLPGRPQDAQTLLYDYFDSRYAAGQLPELHKVWLRSTDLLGRPQMIMAMGGQNADIHRQMLRIYRRLEADRKGTLLIAGLARFRDANGKWPENLAEIKPLVSPDNFIDPLNNGEFVYKLTEDGFTLYSKGLNGIDEEGKMNKGCDDWMIWPMDKCENKQEDDNEQQQTDRNKSTEG